VEEARMKMRAAVLEEFGEPLVVQEVDLADPKPGEVLVRLVACGVCHTDLYTASGADPSGYASAVLGHEGAGVVEKVGEGVRSVSEGDHVVTLFSRNAASASTAGRPGRTCAWRFASSRTRATCRTARPGSRAAGTTSATSWAPARSRSTR
jgi:Zn-dependent alcohol dehydrogenase